MSHTKLFINVESEALRRSLSELFENQECYMITPHRHEADVVISERPSEGDVIVSVPLKAQILFKEVDRYMSQHPFSFCDITVHVVSKELQRGCHVERLTEKEIHLLKYLYTHRNTDIKRSLLLEDVWGYGDAMDTHTLETHIYRLRQKIEKDPTSPQILINGVEGYILKV